MKGEITKDEINDIIIDKPYRFEIDGRLFFLYNETLGKKMFAYHYLTRLGIDDKIMQMNPYLECMRVIHEKDADVCKLIAVHTLRSKEDLFDRQKLNEAAEYIQNHADDDDKVSLLILIFTRERSVDDVKKFYRMNLDDRRREELMRVKKNNNTFMVGGCSIYGNLLDAACERYKWTLDYVLWGISYINLRMMLADAPTSIYLSDDERKHITMSTDNTVINADDPANYRRIVAECSE